MSLDVYLKMKGVQNLDNEEHIFIRENGQTKEISLTEWNDRFPGRIPTTIVFDSDDEAVYSDNITHNLGKMAKEAGLYMHLWRPDEIGITKAKELIDPLRTGLALLRNNPEQFQPFVPSNGWGTYTGLILFVRDYLAACEEYPDADVSVNR